LLWTALSAAFAVVQGADDEVLTLYRVPSAAQQVTADGRLSSVWSAWDVLPLDYILLDTAYLAQGLVAGPEYIGMGLRVCGLYDSAGLYLLFRHTDPQARARGGLTVYLDPFARDTIMAMSLARLGHYGSGAYSCYYREYNATFCDTACPDSFWTHDVVWCGGGPAGHWALHDGPDGEFFDTVRGQADALLEWFLPWGQYGTTGVSMPLPGDRLAFLVGYSGVFPGAFWWPRREDVGGGCPCTEWPEFPVYLWQLCCDVDAWCTYGDLEFGPDLATAAMPRPGHGLAPSRSGTVGPGGWFDLRGNRLASLGRQSSHGPVVRMGPQGGRAVVQVLLGDRRSP